MIFYRFLTWMVFERLPNCNDYKQQQQTLWLEVAETKPGAPATALQSLALAGLLTLLVLF